MANDTAARLLQPDTDEKDVLEDALSFGAESLTAYDTAQLKVEGAASHQPLRAPSGADFCRRGHVGMTCGACVASIESGLRGQAGIKTVTVALL